MANELYFAEVDNLGNHYGVFFTEFDDAKEYALDQLVDMENELTYGWAEGAWYPLDSTMHLNPDRVTEEQKYAWDAMIDNASVRVLFVVDDKMETVWYPNAKDLNDRDFVHFERIMELYS